MSKGPDQMAGVPPRERARFVCKRYHADEPTSVEKGAVNALARIVEEAGQATSPYPSEVLQGILTFLRNTNGHDFEGRAGYDAKDSFAQTELLNALSFPDDRQALQYLAYRYKFATYPSRRLVDDFPLVVAVGDCRGDL